jgi:hypothetical protein
MAKDLAVMKKGGALAKKGVMDLAKYAKEDAARLPSGGGNTISIKGKNFSAQGATLEEPLKLVIVDYSFENALYDSKFDPDNPQPPVCFAVAKTNDELAPHDNSPSPQSEKCKGCGQNQFGTADTGRGKACKNNIRLAVLSTNVKKFDANAVDKAEIFSMRLPPTSVKNFRGFLRQITEGLQLPLFSVITSLSFDEEAATPVVVFQFEEEIGDRKLLTALVTKREAAQEQLLQPYDTSNYVDPGARPKKSGAKPTAKPAKKSKF